MGESMTQVEETKAPEAPAAAPPETNEERHARIAEEQRMAARADAVRRQDEAATTDRLGALNHLVERYSVLDHPALFSISGKAGDVTVEFTFERERNGKWQKVTKSVTAATVGDCVEKLRPELAKAADPQAVRR